MQNCQLNHKKKPPLSGMETIIIETANENLNLNSTTATKLNYFWMIQKYIHPETTKGYNGYMEDLTENNENYEVSVIHFLPFVHAHPSEYDMLYTAILNSVTEARNLNMKMCFITFDQPLYFKACDIVIASSIADDMHIFIRLGGFHTLLSFLGSIGFVMNNSGLKEVLCTVYGDKTAENISAGCQYSRAIRAHTLVFLAIIKLIFSV